jgi:hypothetical protein
MPEIDPMSVHMGFVVDKVALEQVFRVFQFSCHNSTTAPCSFIRSFIHSSIHLLRVLYILSNRQRREIIHYIK